MKKTIKNISRVLFILLLIFSIFGTINVLAEEIIFKVTNISVKEKSDSVTVNNASLSNGQLNNDVEFKYKDDYIKYSITIKNNTNKDYTIKSISDDNTSTYLEYTYSDLNNVKVEAGKEKTFEMQIKYINQTNKLLVTDKAVNITLNYETEGGTTGTETITNNNKITNPKTGDNISLYIILGLVSVTGLVITTVSKKRLSKSLMVIALTSTIILPLGVKADTNNLLIKFNNNINSYRGAGFYDEDDYLVMDYKKFKDTYNFDVESDVTTMYIQDPETKMWLYIDYENQQFVPVDYEDIPDNTPAKMFASEALSNVSKLILPEGITKIGMTRFATNQNIKEIVLPDSLTTIGISAFASSNIEKINIPKNVETIEMSAFYYCQNLSSLTFEKNSKLKRIGDGAFQYNTSLEEITIPKSVTTIEDSAFSRSGLQKVVFEKGSQLEAIPDYAFELCHDLESVVMPENIISIGNCAFQENKFKTITIPKTVKYTVNGAFAGNTELETVIFEEGSQFETLGSGTFHQDVNLKNIVLPDSLTTIEHGAFSECEGLETLNIPANVTYIDADTFYHNYSLKTAYFENPNGWSRYYGQNVNNQTPISSTDLSDPEQAAITLYQLNLAYKWVRN